MNIEKKLYQWDTEQKLTGCTGLYVDFPIGNEVYRVETIDGTCIIPDELLQTSGSHKVYECMTNNTIRSFAFSVTPRPKPPDYVYTPTERLTFEGLVQRVDDAVADMIRRAESGEFDGHTPVKGTDYFTTGEIQQIQNEVSSGAIGEFKSVVDTETETFNTNAESKLTTYNENDVAKTGAYNTNASNKVTEYNSNAENKTAEFDTHTEQIQADISELKSDLVEFEEGIANCEIANRFNQSKVTEGYIPSSGNFISDSAWRCTDFIPCNAETLYFSCNDSGVRKRWGMSFVASYDSNKNLTNHVNTISDGIYTGTNENGFVRFSYKESTARTDYMIRTDDSYNDYCEYNKAYTIKESSLPISALANKGVLYGKKYCACGDSYTEGAFDGSPDNSYLDENGIPKTYHYFIGKRNEMEVINCGKSGSIMALNKDYVEGKITNPKMDSPFAYERYLEVPLDSDYITLAFGINDASRTNLGTIDDTTNETFYGAWNVVLDYFLQNAPFAKVGIIIYTPNQQYHDAIVAIAKKWGKKVLDFSGEDSNLPWFMPERIGMSAEINAKYKELYRVSDTNKGHPSWQAHEFESTIIENFLRSL